MIHIRIKNGSAMELADGSTAKDLAELLNLKGPSEALAALVNGKKVDLSHPLREADQVEFLNFDDAEGKDVFWHTSAHVLAQAILRLYPDAKPTIGPPIDNGFYYDFANLTVSEADFEKIETEMKKIVDEKLVPLRQVFSSKEEALKAFSDNEYKLEMIRELEEGQEISAYKQGEFFDLCRGPHLSSLSKIKALKLLKTSGAYWRGDPQKEMLTRVYAITFPDRALLKEYLQRIEEAKKRDHKVLGPKLDLFSLKEEAPGMPFIHPKGMIVWNALFELWRELHFKARYQEIKTPTMMSRELWELSGHWFHYRQNMFTSEIDEREYAIKPMNCPGACLFFRSRVYSYRDLPLRVAEIGHVHRYEASGALSGLFRVRSFHQDDAHIFMKPEDIQGEILGVLSLIDEMYSVFGLSYHLELSTRPKENTIGSDEDWERATTGLQRALEQTGRPFRINEGDGAFYGPKIDVHVKDALGRTWQCATIQLDMNFPEKFQLEYTTKDGSRQRPIMIHRVIYGAVERFMGILIEHFGGKFPLWLSPRQMRILCVADRHAPYAHELNDALRQANFHSEVDDSQESVGKKVRNAQLDQVNYILTVGDQEVEHRTLSLRTRDNMTHGEMTLDKFMEQVLVERQQRLLTSPFTKSDKR